jgi:hypothetical protein
MKRALLYILVVTTIISCKKYEEGPALSLRSPKKRISAEWEVVKYTVDGKDAFDQSFPNTIYCQTSEKIDYSERVVITKFTWTINESGNWTFRQNLSGTVLDSLSTFELCNDHYFDAATTKTNSGTWKFLSSKTKIELHYDKPGYTPEVYKILKLKEKEMKMSYSYGNTLYEFEMEKR